MWAFLYCNCYIRFRLYNVKLIESSGIKADILRLAC